MSWNDFIKQLSRRECASWNWVAIPALLAAVSPSDGLGIDASAESISAAQQMYANAPELKFIAGNV